MCTPSLLHFSYTLHLDSYVLMQHFYTTLPLYSPSFGSQIFLNQQSPSSPANMGDSEAASQIVERKGEEPNRPNPLFSLFSNFLHVFNFPPPKVAAAKPEKTVSETVPATPVDEDEPKVAVVRFPDTRPEVSPLKLESEELERDTNPVVLWQVYAIGGFFVLRWVWARWNERRGKKRPSNDDPSVADD